MRKTKRSQPFAMPVEVPGWSVDTIAQEKVLARYRDKWMHDLRSLALNAMVHDVTREQLVELVRAAWEAETAALRAARQQRDAATASANGAADDHRKTGKGDRHE